MIIKLPFLGADKTTLKIIEINIHSRWDIKDSIAYISNTFLSTQVKTPL